MLRNRHKEHRFRSESTRTCLQYIEPPIFCQDVMVRSHEGPRKQKDILRYPRKMSFILRFRIAVLSEQILFFAELFNKCTEIVLMVREILFLYSGIQFRTDLLACISDIIHTPP